MVVAIAVASALVLGMLWAVSGASPFVWLVIIGVHGEAVRQQFFASLIEAARHFSANYPKRVRRVRFVLAGAVATPSVD